MSRELVFVGLQPKAALLHNAVLSETPVAHATWFKV
jgi:hypothetical protein